VHFPQESTIDHLRSKVLTYLNIFLDGDLHRLPREILVEAQGIKEVNLPASVVRGFLRYLPLMLHAALPFVAYAITTSALDWSPSPPSHLALLYAYLIWLVWGVASSIEKLSPDAKSFVIDILRTIFGRN
jgi:branched-subunit amino acid transport protein